MQLITGSKAGVYKNTVNTQMFFTFLRYMLVGKQEDHLLVLDSEFVVKNLEIFSEARFIVSSTQCNLKDLTIGCETSQLRQGLKQHSTD